MKTCIALVVNILDGVDVCMFSRVDIHKVFILVTVSRIVE